MSLGSVGWRCFIPSFRGLFLVLFRVFQCRCTADRLREEGRHYTDEHRGRLYWFVGQTTKRRVFLLKAGGEVEPSSYFRV